VTKEFRSNRLVLLEYRCSRGLDLRTGETGAQGAIGLTVQMELKGARNNRRNWSTRCSRKWDQGDKGKN
jgi:hypothetical protein